MRAPNIIGDGTEPAKDEYDQVPLRTWTFNESNTIMDFFSPDFTYCIARHYDEVSL